MPQCTSAASARVERAGPGERHARPDRLRPSIGVVHAAIWCDAPAPVIAERHERRAEDAARSRTGAPSDSRSTARYEAPDGEPGVVRVVESPERPVSSGLCVNGHAEGRIRVTHNPVGPRLRTTTREASESASEEDAEAGADHVVRSLAQE